MPGVMLPPGFRFHPTDEELVAYYLRKRVKGSPIEFDVVADVDLYKCEPWDLPPKSRLPTHDFEWFFFSPRDRKYPNGARTNRATEAGYWKATGRDRFVKTGSKTIGMKKTLVFYLGRAPHGERTHWLMHEYRLDGEEWEATTVSQEAYVLCRVFKKNGLDLPNLAGVGSGEEVDHADSPSDDKSSVLYEYNVKPSTELPPQPLSSSAGTHHAPLSAISLGEQVLEALPLASFPAMQPSNEPPLSIFDVDGMPSFPKMESGNLEWMDYLFRDDTPDFAPIPIQDQTPDGRSEFSKGGWPQDPVFAGNFPSDTPWNVKYEDPVGMQNSLPPAMRGEGFDELDLLPPLEDQSPSPPTVLPATSFDESCGSVDSPFQPTSIQIRPRLASSLKSPVVRAAPIFTAHRRVLIKKSNRPPPPVEEDEEHESSEPIQKMAAGSTEVVPDTTTVSADEVREADAISAGVVPESEVENVGPQKPSETTSAMSSVHVLQSSSQLTQPAIAFESALPRPLDNDVNDKGTREVNKQLADLDQHPSMKSAVSDVDNQKSVTAVFHIKGYKELPTGIGSIHVNAVTISCSCDNVSSKPHVQATVCDCYDNSKGANSQVLEEPRGRTYETGLEGRQSTKGRGGFRKSFTCVFLMGAVSACVGFFLSHEFWRVSCQLVRNGVQTVTAASDL